MNYKLLFFLFIGAIHTLQAHADTVPTTLLYHKVLDEMTPSPELVPDDGLAADYIPEGLNITGKEGTIRLDRYYSLSERMIRYHVKFSNDAVALFKSNSGDFSLFVNIAEKRVSVVTEQEVWKKMDFLNADHEYLVEIYRSYQTSLVRIVDVYTGASDLLKLTTDGPGGWGIAIENSEFYAGRQHDYYCFGLQAGSSLLVKQISVLAGASDLFLLLYGDSITEPDGYYPTRDFPSAWTQLILKNVPGRAMGSLPKIGRASCRERV